MFDRISNLKEMNASKMLNLQEMKISKMLPFVEEVTRYLIY